MTEITENVVYNCDFMKNRLPDHCADLIIADPPYFRYKGDFDFVWPTFDDYLNDVRRWGEECRRLLKDNGTLIWWGSDNRIAYTQVILDTMFLFLNSCTWNKSNGWGKVQNAEISRKFIPNAERFILYESKPEIREGEARKILRVFEYEQDVPDTVHEASGRLHDLGNGTGRLHTEACQRCPAYLHGRTLVHARLTMGIADPREL